VFVYDNATIRMIRDLSEAGYSDYAIANKTGIARQTVMRWRHRGFPERAEQSSSWTVAVPDYPYVLGLYLGDGCLSQPGRATTYTLDLACDLAYPGSLGRPSKHYAPSSLRQSVAGTRTKRRVSTCG
jgi:hypothetical protein